METILLQKQVADTAAPKTKYPLDTLYLTGLGLILFSFGLYLFTSSRLAETGGAFAFFFIHYIIAVFYLVSTRLILTFGSGKKDQSRFAHWINTVILFTISAFALNRELLVFAPFPMWLNVYTILCLPLFLVFPWYRFLPDLAKSLVLALTGASFLLSVYTLLYLMPILPLSIPGLLVFGISVHSYIPLAWLTVLYRFVFKSIGINPGRFIPIGVGVVIPLVTLTFYLYKWHQIQSETQEIIASLNLQVNQLPQALYLAQRLPADPFTDEILMAPFHSQRFWSDGFRFDMNGQRKFHDPLSVIAQVLFGELSLDEKTVIQILNIRRDYRHKTRQKLWTGISLETATVANHIEVFPRYRLAYQEKTITIHHDPHRNTDNVWFVTPTQEALYTFHLPEGSIVTSLSLWVNGVEEKSRLTTRQKADSAYSQIVGVQRRDPSLVHWREGNTVTVNVFPCTDKEDRKFKIGFTTPLRAKGDSLILESIWFEGPDGKNAHEATRILMRGDGLVADAEAADFEKQADGSLLYKGDYRPFWQLRMKKPPLSDRSFSFQGNEYRVQELAWRTVSAPIESVYLDITCQWTRTDFDRVIQELRNKKLYAWLPAKTRITPENQDKVWQYTHKNQFSVPFLYDVHKPESAVVLTKTPHRSPILGELKESDLSWKFETYFQNQVMKPWVINFGEEVSPFWRSMQELRLVQYQNCPLDQALSQAKTGLIRKAEENENQISLVSSSMAITKRPVSDSARYAGAPDHLMRVFAYNHVIRRIGPRFLENKLPEEELLQEAEEAYVVTPATSFIVLETVKDYEDHGIVKNQHSLGNATVSGGGAVPEPHEWLLIGLVGALVAWTLLKNRLASLF